MHPMLLRTFRPIALALILTTLSQSGTAQANWLCDKIFLSNKPVIEGGVVKSPMKVDPLLVRLYKNVAFFTGMIKYPTRNIQELPVNFLSDYEFMSQKRVESRLGKINSFYDPEFDTKFYHSLTGSPLPDGTMPVVDPNSKALFVYLHGSGTNKAGGANFSYKANELSKLGFSALSFDMPFHADGTQNRKIANTERFMAQLNRIIEKYRIPGKPVFIAGHSFGPELVFEYVTRYPHGVNGAIALSPAAFNDDLNRWFMKVTSQATSFWGDTRPNHLGGIWGGHVTGQTLWNTPKSGRADPTLVNPDLKLLVLTGDWEEYSPGPMQANGEPAKASRDYDICMALKKYFAHLICTREAGVGHYIFAHKDPYGNDVVLRELLRATQTNAADMESFPARMADELKRLKTENDARKLTETDKLAQRYAREVFFRNWFDQKAGGILELQRLIAAEDQAAALVYSKHFDLILQQREAQIKINVAKLIEQGVIEGGTHDVTLARYFEYLEKSNPAEREALFQTTDIVYEVPPEQLAALKPKAPREKPRETGTARAVDLLSGERFEFDLDQRPTEIEVLFTMDQLKLFRDAKMFKESQPLNEWLKKWVEFKFAKDRSVESWTYRL